MHKQQIAYRLLMAALFVGAFSHADYAKDGKAGEPEWMKLMKPSEGHQVLNDTVGKWKYTMQWWASPGAKPEETKGTSTSKWVLDGRFIQQDVKGTAMGKPFNGIGYTGFDNMTKEYRTTWMDSMSTSMMVSDGKWDADKKTLITNGKGSDPMNNIKNKDYRTELRIENKDSHWFAMFEKDKDGNEFKSMEMHYTRTK